MRRGHAPLEALLEFLHGEKRWGNDRSRGPASAGAWTFGQPRVADMDFDFMRLESELARNRIGEHSAAAGADILRRRGDDKAAAFDGKSWVQTPVNATAGAGTGSVAVADFSGQLYAFYEQNSSVQFSVYDDLTGNWVSQGPVPGVSNPRSTVVTVAGDLLYLAYIGVNTATRATPTYAAAFDGQSWTAPVLISGDNASSVSIAGFVDQIVAVYLGTNGILYGRWSGSGGTTWHNNTPLGQAQTAPGMLPVDVTVGDDSHAQGLLALASWPTSGFYNGLFSREMTTTIT